MSEIKFKCPSCSTELEAPEDMAGDVVECPSCSQNISIPQPSAGVEVASSSGNNHNACPNCQVEMEAEAVICLNCGYHKGLGKVIKTDLS